MQRLFLTVCIVACLLLAGCGKLPYGETAPTTAPAPTTVPITEPTEPVPTEPPSSPAIDMLIMLHGNGILYHAEDYVMDSLLQIEDVKYSINWATDATQDVAVIVPNDNGTVTVDVNELCSEDTTYTLTATVATPEGQWVSHSWTCMLPKAMDTSEIMTAANALEHGQRLSYCVTLTGTISSIAKSYDADYESITLTIRIPDYDNQAIRCYGLQGAGIENLQIGDTIAVRGFLQKYSSLIEFDSGCTLVAIVTPVK